MHSASQNIALASVKLSKLAKLSSNPQSAISETVFKTRPRQPHLFTEPVFNQIYDFQIQFQIKLLSVIQTAVTLRSFDRCGS